MRILLVDAPDFEAAMHACELALAEDFRIRDIPGARRTSAKKVANSLEHVKTIKSTRKRGRL
jgi:hypothetical protein